MQLLKRPAGVSICLGLGEGVMALVDVEGSREMSVGKNDVGPGQIWLKLQRQKLRLFRASPRRRQDSFLVVVERGEPRDVAVLGVIHQRASAAAREAVGLVDHRAGDLQGGDVLHADHPVSDLVLRALALGDDLVGPGRIWRQRKIVGSRSDIARSCNLQAALSPARQPVPNQPFGSSQDLPSSKMEAAPFRRLNVVWTRPGQCSSSRPARILQRRAAALAERI